MTFPAKRMNSLHLHAPAVNILSSSAVEIAQSTSDIRDYTRTCICTWECAINMSFIYQPQQSLRVVARAFSNTIRYEAHRHIPDVAHANYALW